MILQACSECAEGRVTAALCAWKGRNLGEGRREQCPQGPFPAGSALAGWQQGRCLASASLLCRRGWSSTALQHLLDFTSWESSMCCAESAPWFFFVSRLPAASCCGTSWGGQKLNFVNVFLSPGESKVSASAAILCRRALPCASSAFLSLPSKLKALSMLQGASEVGPAVNEDDSVAQFRN